MKTYREDALPPAITGTLMHLNERDAVAFYVRDGVCRVAEFRDGRAELTDATSWFRFNAGVLRYWHRRRATGLESTTPLTPEIVERIERIHLQIDARDARIIDMTRTVLATIQRSCTEFASKIRSLSSKRMQRSS